MNRKKIVVAGGGPAGIMASIRASQLNQDVVLIEKNPTLGKKLLLSGKGRCNLTNACDLETFLARFSKNGQFLRDAFKKFFNQQLIDFFEQRGLKLKIERQLRVFPASDRSNSILKVLKNELAKLKVNIIYKGCVKDIIVKNNLVKGVVLSDGRLISLDKLILATGGLSYRFTGSTGEGIDLAKRLGHRVVPLRPGLVPLEVRQKFPQTLEGLALKNIRLKFVSEDAQIITEIGELLFTDFGISGPLVLSSSNQVSDWLAEKRPIFVEIDLKPALSREKLDLRLIRDFKFNSKVTIRNTLKNLLPRKLIDLFLEMTGINPRKLSNQVLKSEREKLVSLLKAMRLDITRTRPLDEAMVTRGGISLKDINPRTMESRLIKGLYFCGEMIDIDADTGGFNLQAAFSTGFLAGENAALN